jgi:hypothetical protein
MVSTDNVSRLYISDLEFDALGEAEKMEYYYCPDCKRLYHREALGGECGCHRGNLSSAIVDQ